MRNGRDRNYCKERSAKRKGKALASNNRLHKIQPKINVTVLQISTGRRTIIKTQRKTLTRVGKERFEFLKEEMTIKYRSLKVAIKDL